MTPACLFTCFLVLLPTNFYITNIPPPRILCIIHIPPSPAVSDKMKAEIKRRCDTAFSPVEEQRSVTSLISLGVDSCFRLRHDNGEQR